MVPPDFPIVYGLAAQSFFDALVAYCPQVTPDEVVAVGGLIADQPWYFRYWRLDPTIQASLLMLDAIHKLFRDSEGFLLSLSR